MPGNTKSTADLAASGDAVDLSSLNGVRGKNERPTQHFFGKNFQELHPRDFVCLIPVLGETKSPQDLRGLGFFFLLFLRCETEAT